ncbi:MAG TPA: hypothetical protein PKH15_04820 [Bacteroidales bacterium]|jgi:hypothetical protein|nr:hypothetical protein [Bacteroidales bacterium]
MKNKFIVFFLFFGLLAFSNFEANAQCFASPGNPVAGSANVGVLHPRIFRLVLFHKFSYSDSYYSGSKFNEYDFPAAIKNANYNYTGMSLAYGLKPKLSLELDLGYFINKTQNYRYIDYQLKGYGLSNIGLTAKYNIYKNPVKMLEITVGGGLKAPFRLEPQVVNGVRLDVDVQPSTGNFGFNLQALFVKEFENISTRLIVLSRYDNNFTENRMGYKFGDAFSNSIFISKHLANKYTELTKDITIICQFRHEYKKVNYLNGKVVKASGSNILYIAPQINYNFKMVWNFSFIFEKPIYHYYNETQLGNKYSLLLSITKDIGYKIKM